MKQIENWINKQIEDDFAQLKEYELLAKELRKEYGYRYLSSLQYREIPKYFRNLMWQGKEYQLERITKDVRNHFVRLQAKVNERIGDIIEIKHYGGEDYLFKGVNGEVGVRVIVAGGHNIQRIHTRWIFDRKAIPKK